MDANLTGKVSMDEKEEAQIIGKLARYLLNNSNLTICLISFKPISELLQLHQTSKEGKG